MADDASPAPQQPRSVSVEAPSATSSQQHALASVRPLAIHRPDGASRSRQGTPRVGGGASSTPRSTAYKSPRVAARGNSPPGRLRAPDGRFQRPVSHVQEDAVDDAVLSGYSRDAAPTLAERPSAFGHHTLQFVQQHTARSVYDDANAAFFTVGDAPKTVATDIEFRCVRPVGDRNVWAAERDGRISVLDVERGMIVSRGERKRGSFALAICVVGGTLVWVGFTDGFVRVFDASVSDPSATPPLYEAKAHSGAVQLLVESNDGSMVFSGSDDFTVVFWHADTLQRRTMVSGHSLPIRAIHEVTSRLVVGSDDGRISLWNSNSLLSDDDIGGHICTVDAHDGGVKCIASTPDYVWTGGDDGFLRAWKLVASANDTGAADDGDGAAEAFQLIHMIGEPHNGPVTALRIVGSKVWSVCYATIFVWDAETFQHYGQLCRHEGYVVDFAPVHESLVSSIWSVGVEGGIKIWKAESLYAGALRAQRSQDVASLEHEVHKARDDSKAARHLAKQAKEEAAAAREGQEAARAEANEAKTAELRARDDLASCEQALADANARIAELEKLIATERGDSTEEKVKRMLRRGLRVQPPRVSTPTSADPTASSIAELDGQSGIGEIEAAIAKLQEVVADRRKQLRKEIALRGLPPDELREEQALDLARKHAHAVRSFVSMAALRAELTTVNMAAAAALAELNSSSTATTANAYSLTVEQALRRGTGVEPADAEALESAARGYSARHPVAINNADTSSRDDGNAAASVSAADDDVPRLGRRAGGASAATGVAPKTDATREAASRTTLATLLLDPETTQEQRLAIRRAAAAARFSSSSTDRDGLVVQYADVLVAPGDAAGAATSEASRHGGASAVGTPTSDEFVSPIRRRGTPTPPGLSSTPSPAPERAPPTVRVPMLAFPIAALTTLQRKMLSEVATHGGNATHHGSSSDSSDDAVTPSSAPAVAGEGNDDAAVTKSCRHVLERDAVALELPLLGTTSAAQQTIINEIATAVLGHAVAPSGDDDAPASAAATAAVYGDASQPLDESITVTASCSAGCVSHMLSGLGGLLQAAAANAREASREAVRKAVGAAAQELEQLDVTLLHVENRLDLPTASAANGSLSPSKGRAVNDDERGNGNHRTEQLLSDIAALSTRVRAVSSDLQGRSLSRVDDRRLSWSQTPRSHGVDSSLQAVVTTSEATSVATVAVAETATTAVAASQDQSAGLDEPPSARQVDAQVVTEQPAGGDHMTQTSPREVADTATSAAATRESSPVPTAPETAAAQQQTDDATTAANAEEPVEAASPPALRRGASAAREASEEAATAMRRRNERLQQDLEEALSRLDAARQQQQHRDDDEREAPAAGADVAKEDGGEAPAATRASESEAATKRLESDVARLQRELAAERSRQVDAAPARPGRRAQSAEGTATDDDKETIAALRRENERLHRLLAEANQDSTTAALSSGEVPHASSAGPSAADRGTDDATEDRGDANNAAVHDERSNTVDGGDSSTTRDVAPADADSSPRESADSPSRSRELDDEASAAGKNNVAGSTAAERERGAAARDESERIAELEAQVTALQRDLDVARSHTATGPDAAPAPAASVDVNERGEDVTEGAATPQSDAAESAAVRSANSADRTERSVDDADDKTDGSSSVVELRADNARLQAEIEALRRRLVERDSEGSVEQAAPGANETRERAADGDRDESSPAATPDEADGAVEEAKDDEQRHELRDEILRLERELQLLHQSSTADADGAQRSPSVTSSPGRQPDEAGKPDGTKPHDTAAPRSIETAEDDPKQGNATNPAAGDASPPAPPAGDDAPRDDDTATTRAQKSDGEQQNTAAPTNDDDDDDASRRGREEDAASLRAQLEALREKNEQLERRAPTDDRRGVSGGDQPRSAASAASPAATSTAAAATTGDQRVADLEAEVASLRRQLGEARSSSSSAPGTTTRPHNAATTEAPAGSARGRAGDAPGRDRDASNSASPATPQTRAASPHSNAEALDERLEQRRRELERRVAQLQADNDALLRHVSELTGDADPATSESAATVAVASTGAQIAPLQSDAETQRAAQPTQDSETATAPPASTADSGAQATTSAASVATQDSRRAADPAPATARELDDSAVQASAATVDTGSQRAADATRDSAAGPTDPPASTGTAGVQASAATTDASSQRAAQSTQDSETATAVQTRDGTTGSDSAVASTSDCAAQASPTAMSVGSQDTRRAAEPAPAESSARQLDDSAVQASAATADTGSQRAADATRDSAAGPTDPPASTGTAGVQASAATTDASSQRAAQSTQDSETATLPAPVTSDSGAQASPTATSVGSQDARRTAEPASTADATARQLDDSSVQAGATTSDAASQRAVDETRDSAVGSDHAAANTHDAASQARGAATHDSTAQATATTETTGTQRSTVTSPVPGAPAAQVTDASTQRAPVATDTSTTATGASPPPPPAAVDDESVKPAAASPVEEQVNALVALEGRLDALRDENDRLRQELALRRSRATPASPAPPPATHTATSAAAPATADTPAASDAAQSATPPAAAAAEQSEAATRDASGTSSPAPQQQQPQQAGQKAKAGTAASGGGSASPSRVSSPTRGTFNVSIPPTPGEADGDEESGVFVSTHRVALARERQLTEELTARLAEKEENRLRGRRYMLELEEGNQRAYFERLQSDAFEAYLGTHRARVHDAIVAGIETHCATLVALARQEGAEADARGVINHAWFDDLVAANVPAFLGLRVAASSEIVASTADSVQLLRDAVLGVHSEWLQTTSAALHSIAQDNCDRNAVAQAATQRASELETELAELRDELRRRIDTETVMRSEVSDLTHDLLECRNREQQLLDNYGRDAALVTLRQQVHDLEAELAELRLRFSALPETLRKHAVASAAQASSGAAGADLDESRASTEPPAYHTDPQQQQQQQSPTSGEGEKRWKPEQQQQRTPTAPSVPATPPPGATTSSSAATRDDAQPGDGDAAATDGAAAASTGRNDETAAEPALGRTGAASTRSSTQRTAAAVDQAAPPPPVYTRQYDRTVVQHYHVKQLEAQEEYRRELQAARDRYDTEREEEVHHLRNLVKQLEADRKAVTRTRAEDRRRLQAKIDRLEVSRRDHYHRLSTKASTSLAGRSSTATGGPPGESPLPRDPNAQLKLDPPPPGLTDDPDVFEAQLSLTDDERKFWADRDRQWREFASMAQDMHKAHADLLLESNALSSKLESLSYIFETRPTLIRSLHTLFRLIAASVRVVEGQVRQATERQPGRLEAINRTEKVLLQVDECREGARWIISNLFTAAELHHLGASPCQFAPDVRRPTWRDISVPTRMYRYTRPADDAAHAAADGHEGGTSRTRSPQRIGDGGDAPAAAAGGGAGTAASRSARGRSVSPPEAPGRDAAYGQPIPEPRTNDSALPYIELPLQKLRAGGDRGGSAATATAVTPGRRGGTDAAAGQRSTAPTAPSRQTPLSAAARHSVGARRAGGAAPSSSTNRASSRDVSSRRR